MITKNLSKNFFISFLIILIIFLIDRFSKLFVIKLDSQNDSSEIFLSKFLNIQLIWNEGVAFGLLSFEDGKLYNIITVFILLVILVIFFIIIKSSGVKKYSLLMIVGGALGNFYDRVLNKAVPDFIDNNDEFLVEKKSPLVMPPDFNELPMPKTNDGVEVSSENSIKDLITSKDVSSQDQVITENSSNNFEESFLKKINKN